ncbi:hypothetical protein AWN76_003960 [Rhodothermaceae bacterium RA]|nr:hypothetical protein AWN76_003960 [Rhodothermaceae bacterium RA]
MTLLLALMIAAAGSGPDPSVGDSARVLYAHKDVAALERLLAAAPTRADALLCRYRLYPLHRQERYLADLPADLPDGTARERALLAGLWGYRAGNASLYHAIRFGRRAEQLLAAAHALDPDDPFLLLIEGQSLLFKPRIAGGDARAALDRFRRLQEVIRRRPDEGIDPLEVEVWIWYTLNRLEDDAAPALRARLLAQDLPPLFREFLLDPP